MTELNSHKKNRRILVIDDQSSIFEDFRKILGKVERPQDLDRMGVLLFGDDNHDLDSVEFELEYASQGSVGLDKVLVALSQGNPFAVAFVDMRMPPGWDGLETIERVWRLDPDIQTVICSAYTDYPLHEIHKRLGYTDRLLILKKPFENIEVFQLACALTEKWNLARQTTLQMRDLNWLLHQRAMNADEALPGLHPETAPPPQKPQDKSNLDKQLRQIQKMEIVGQLMQGTAVSFNNLLAGVIGSTSLVMNALPPEHKHYALLEASVNSARKAGDLIRQLVTMTHLSSQEKRPTGLVEVLETMGELIRKCFDPRITLRIEHAPDLRTVFADVGQLYQALFALCLLARDELEESERLNLPAPAASLSLMAQNVDFDRDFPPFWVYPRTERFVMLSIEYPAPGALPEATPPADEESKSRQDRAKLMLSIVQSMIRDLGGWMTAYSEAGQTTVYRIYLPEADAQSLACGPFLDPKDFPRPTQIEPPARSDETILFIEDDDGIQRVVKEVLEPLGYRILLANDGQQGIKLYHDQQAQIALVMLDLMLPKVSGKDVFKQLRAINPKVKILINSGVSDPPLLQDLTDIAGFIEKPFDYQTLVKAVRQACGKN